MSGWLNKNVTSWEAIASKTPRSLKWRIIKYYQKTADWRRIWWQIVRTIFFIKWNILNFQVQNLRTVFKLKCFHRTQIYAALNNWIWLLRKETRLARKWKSGKKRMCRLSLILLLVSSVPKRKPLSINDPLSWQSAHWLVKTIPFLGGFYFSIMGFQSDTSRQV